MLSCAVVGLAGSVAHASPEEGKALAEEAAKLAAANQMVAAAAKFREAYASDPRPEYVCNVGVAYLKAPDLPRAQRYLNDCTQLGASLSKDFLANVRKVMETVEAKLVAGNYTPVDLLVEPVQATILVQGGDPFDEPIVGSRRAWFPYGSYKLVVHAEGYTDRVVELAAKDHTAVRLATKLDKLTESAPNEKPPGEPPPGDPPPGEPPIAPARERRPSTLPPIAATAVTGVAAVSGAILYYLAYQKREDANQEPAGAGFDAARSAMESRLLGARIAGGVAIVGAGVSAYLWYRATRSTSTTLEVQATGSGAAVVFGGRF